jgi:DNA-binding MarR family transcriptional regulator
VLNEIAMAAPIDWPTLTAQLQRDHSQAGRTVRALLDKGLIAREGRPGRRHGRFSPTAEGWRLYDIIQETSVERSSFLMAPLGEEERKRFLGTFDKLRRNAVAMLSRAGALEELDRAGYPGARRLLDSGDLHPRLLADHHQIAAERPAFDPHGVALARRAVGLADTL